MPFFNYRPLVFCFLALLFAWPLQAQPDQNANNKTLTVGVAGDAPFVMHDAAVQSFEGISIDIWEEIADEKKLVLSV